MHTFIQEIINISYGLVFIFCCYNCARLTWRLLDIPSLIGNKSNELPGRKPDKIADGRPDLGNDCKSHIIFLTVEMYNCVTLKGCLQTCNSVTAIQRSLNCNWSLQEIRVQDSTKYLRFTVIFLSFQFILVCLLGFCRHSGCPLS